MKIPGMRFKDIAAFYSMSPYTASNIIKRCNRDNVEQVKKKSIRFKLSFRAIRMYRNYVISNCFDPLFVIVAKFLHDTDFIMIVSLRRRYIKILSMHSYIVVQRPFKTS